MCGLSHQPSTAATGAPASPMPSGPNSPESPTASNGTQALANETSTPMTIPAKRSSIGTAPYVLLCTITLCLKRDTVKWHVIRARATLGDA